MARPVVLVSNRGPLSFRIEAGRAVARRGAGGLVSGLAPLVAGTDTMWIATAMSDADRAAAEQGLVEADGLRVRMLAIDPATQRQAYDVIGNATLWFVHHGLHDLARRPLVDHRWYEAWAAYRRFNERFAAAVVAEAPPDARVLVQDYHLALLGPMIRRHRPDLRTVHFSHTPFAPPMMLRVLPRPMAAELLEGIAGHHARGFHSERWAADFRACCREVLGREPSTFVAPLGPDPADIAAAARTEACSEALRRLEAAVGDRRLIVRVDRIELSKNLLRGFRAFDRLLAQRRDLREGVVFHALGYPSREGLAEYLAYRQEVEATVAVINGRWRTPTWTPIVLDLGDDHARSVAGLRRYDVLLVNPIRDGLNLVAAEGPLVNERDGLVVLSREAGIHDQLAGAALGVNPFDVQGQADTLGTALDAPTEERRRRSRELRRRAGLRTPGDWFDDQLAAAG